MNTIDLILSALQFLTKQLQKAIDRKHRDAEALIEDANALLDAAGMLRKDAARGAKLVSKMAKLAD